MRGSSPETMQGSVRAQRPVSQPSQDAYFKLEVRRRRRLSSHPAPVWSLPTDVNPEVRRWRPLPPLGGPLQSLQTDYNL